MSRIVRPLRGPLRTAIGVAPRDTAVTSISAAFNWQLPVDFSGKSVVISGQGETSPRRVRFSSDGLNMYISGVSNRTVYQYTLTVPFDVSTASFASKSFLFTSQDTGAVGLAFSPDGTKMYMCGITTDTVYQYTLSTPGDVSTASFASKSKLVSAEDTAPEDLAFSTDGTKMYVFGQANGVVFQYTLSTPFDVSTASFASKSVLIGVEVDTPRGIEVSPGEDKMYVAGHTSGIVFIHQYTMTTPGDISTAIHDNPVVNVENEDTTPFGVTFKGDGSIMYMIGATGDKVYQYTVGDYA